MNTSKDTIELTLLSTVTMIVFLAAMPAHSEPTLPCLDLPMDKECLPMPVVMGISQTNRCELYSISNGLYRAATTPETFWLFPHEKTNLWYEAISNRNAQAAMRISLYYALSRNDEVQSLRWCAAALALGHKEAADHIEKSASYWIQRPPLSAAFALSDHQCARLRQHAEQRRDWRSALRLSLYFGFSDMSHEKKLYWLRKAREYGCPVAAYYIDLLSRSAENH